MQNNEDVVPEIKLLNSIINEELKDEGNTELKEVIEKKAKELYLLLDIFDDDDAMKKKIKFHIEGGE